MKETNWTKWSSIAEIISSVAVLLTLIYLAVQTTQIFKQTELNTAAIMSNSRQEALTAELAMLFNFAEYPPQSFVDAGMAPEVYREGIQWQTIFRIRESLWLQYQNNVIDEETWSAYRNQLVNLLNSTPRMKEVWERIETNNGYNPSFINEINSNMNEL